jgi:ssDNA-binding Zn-finger/Zn-ribbon topoisomerase 1
VKELESDGVGRPSTYASILSTIQEREYVRKDGGKFIPTELGMVVTDLLLESFSDLFDVTYTARMEAELDEIEEGKIDWRMSMSEFYERFRRIWTTRAHMTDIKRMEEPTDLICEKCGKPMVIKWGRHGSFIACTGYPECTNTRELTVDLPDIDKADLRAGRSRVLRELRAAHGAQERALRAVSGLHRLSRLQDHQAAGGGAEAPGRAARRESARSARATGAEIRPLRGVRGVQQLSQVQVRQTEDHRREVPELLRGRGGRAALQARQDVFRLQPLSRLRFRGVGQADSGKMSGVRRQLSDRKIPEGRPGGAVSQQRMQVQETSSGSG